MAPGAPPIPIDPVLHQNPRTRARGVHARTPISSGTYTTLFVRSAMGKAALKFAIEGRQPHVAVGRPVWTTLGAVRHHMTEYQSSKVPQDMGKAIIREFQ